MTDGAKLERGRVGIGSRHWTNGPAPTIDESVSEFLDESNPDEDMRN